MSKEQTKDLLKFLKPFNKEIIERALWLREFIWDLYPQTNELIYDNYNALAVGWSPTDRVGHTFCSIAVGRTSNNVHFGFYWGSEISDPGKILLRREPIPLHPCSGQKQISQSVHQKTCERSLCQFAGKSERQKADHERPNNCKVGLSEKAGKEDQTCKDKKEMIFLTCVCFRLNSFIRETCFLQTK